MHTINIPSIIVLPEPFELLALHRGELRTHILVKVMRTVDPLYATYDLIEENGRCEHGHYFTIEERALAREDFCERAGLAPGLDSVPEATLAAAFFRRVGVAVQTSNLERLSDVLAALANACAKASDEQWIDEREHAIAKKLADTVGRLGSRIHTAHLQALKAKEEARAK